MWPIREYHSQMRNSCLGILVLALATAPVMHGQTPSALEQQLREQLGPDTAHVALVYLNRSSHETVSLAGQRRYHAASTMKIPVLIELARRIDAGELGWDSTLSIRNQFASIVDGSPYSLDPADDSDSTLYLEEGRPVSLRRLARLMIARSSNLATNLLITKLTAPRVLSTARSLGADSIMVLRGVEDSKAYAQGLNNTTTAWDLAALLEAIASGRAASPAGTREMLDALMAQEFNDAIPAGLPAGTRVAHKTGEITAILHDAAIVYPEDRAPFVLVILTRGYPDRTDAARLVAQLARTVYSWADRRPEPRE